MMTTDICSQKPNEPDIFVGFYMEPTKCFWTNQVDQVGKTTPIYGHLELWYSWAVVHLNREAQLTVPAISSFIGDI